MFERFTEKARRVIFFGRYEALQFGSRYIETEHLLLGVLREGKVLTLRLFKHPGTIDDIRKDIEGHSVTGERISTSVDLPLSNECKRVLAYAAEEAERLAHKNIGVGHLLLGLLREEKCFAAEMLRKCGINLASARELVKTIEADPTAPQAAHTVAGARSFDIAELGVNLTEQAMNGSLPVLIGRESELERMMRVLLRLTRGNPVLVGEPGIGKKSIVYGLAHRIAQCKAPSNLQDSGLISLDLAVIASGLKSRSKFEDNLEQILHQLQDWHSMVLFIEGLHTLPQTQRFLNVANVLKPALMQGSVHCISTATPAEYRKAIEAASWMEQLFTVVAVRPPTENEAAEVLRGNKARFENFHGVIYSDDAIEYAVFHSTSYFPDQYLPEKAVDLIDEAGARVKLQQPKLPDEVLEVRKRVKFIRERHDRALENHEFEKARFYSDELHKERENLKAVEEKYKIIGSSTPIISRSDIEMIVSEKTSISIDLLRQSRKSAPSDSAKSS